MSEALSPWPRFATVDVPGHDLPEHLAHRFPHLTVPSGGIAAPTPEAALVVVAAPDGRELIQFGRYSYGPVCLDPSSGQIVDMVGSRGEFGRGPVLVNSTADQFVRTIELATDLFPFHADEGDGDSDYLDAAADAVRAQLEPIDPPAWADDGFWETFHWDITMGGYSPMFFEPGD